MSSEILWINHAGYELRAGGLRIVHDPWLFGLAFEGWALVSESQFTAADFAGVDYIWFSHEHPDHFSPRVVKHIPEEVRATITVLFQETRDKRVVKFCEKLGFKVLELPDRTRIPLNDRVAVTCGVVVGRDSWLFTETPDMAIFNANDCVGVAWKDVAASLSRPVDLLLTQFSYANWVGNPGEHERMKAAAAQKIEEMRAQIEAFRPKTVIPFASYVWFCHPDNFHMNEHANRIGDVARALGEEIDVAVLYPGDRYVPGEAHDNSHAIARYEADAIRHGEPMAIPEEPVAMTELLALAEAEQKRLHERNKLWMLRPLSWAGYLPPVAIYLSDLGEGVSYSMFGGILGHGLSREGCEIACSSVSFAAMLRNGYGYGTLSINGRYAEITPGAAARLSRHFAIAARNEEGDNVPGIFLRGDYVAGKLKGALRKVG